MINVSTLPSSEINRQVDELRNRRVPLTFRRFADPFKVPDTTALLQAILLAQTGQTSAIPNVIMSTSNDPFSAAVNRLKPAPVVLNHEGITHAVVSDDTTPAETGLSPTPSRPTIIPTGVNKTGSALKEEFGVKLQPTSVSTPSMAKIIEKSSTTDYPITPVAPSLKASKNLNVKEALNISHIRQKTAMPVEHNINYNEGLIKHYAQIIRNKVDKVQSLTDQLAAATSVTHQDQLKQKIARENRFRAKIAEKIKDAQSDINILKKEKQPEGDVGAVEKPKPRPRGSRGKKKKVQPYTPL